MCGPGRRIPASGPNPVTTSRPGRRTRAGAESFFQEPIPRTRPRPPRYRPGSGTSPAPGTADPGDHSPPCRSASPNLPRPVRRPRLSGLSIRPDSRQLRMRAASAPHATAYPHRKSHHRPHAPLRLLPFPPPPTARTYDVPPGLNPVPPVVTPSGRRPTHTLPRPVLIPSGHCPCLPHIRRPVRIRPRSAPFSLFPSLRSLFIPPLFPAFSSARFPFRKYFP